MKTCSDQIPDDHIFCPYHWAILDEDVKERLLNAYTPGQNDDRHLKTRKWHRTLNEARQKLRNYEPT